MLIVTRRIGEQLVINGDIRVAVVGVKGDRVQLGTTAPPSVTVNRQEGHEQCSEVPSEDHRRQPMPPSTAPPVAPFVESLASDLTEIAYRIALKHGKGDDWLELQLDLWEALKEAIGKRSGSGMEIQLPYDPRLDVD